MSTQELLRKMEKRNNEDSSSGTPFYMENNSCSESPFLLRDQEQLVEAELRDQEPLLLPLVNVSKIMHKILPPDVKVSKDAKQSIQACVSEFLSFVTAEASEKCKGEKRKTVNGDDIIWALKGLGFDNYQQALGSLLRKFRDTANVKLPLQKPDDGQLLIGTPPSGDLGAGGYNSV